MQAIKKAFLELYSTGWVSVKAAAREVGVDQSTVWRWRQGDPEFDDACQKLFAQVDDMRIVMVEDTVFAQIISGYASAALTIFWLVNRAPHRWRRNPQPPPEADEGRIPAEVLRRIMARRNGIVDQTR